MSEFDPAQHERDVHANYLRLQRYALFDELIDYALDGVVTMPEAIAQYKHDAERLEADAV